ncbi:MAG: T9SS type A sorting domain-containing protein [Candidatus Electryonea clarkiae]|nr:T9SS type A sorting domain-containing protein [Candidatus Electryonea clarkiae]MDP8285112.1 T9SS type A sorting domain-containing protein [Candidatus Electryonea clarkiae]
MKQEIEDHIFELISFYFHPGEPSAFDLFNTIDNLLIAYEDNGKVVIPPVLNTIDEIDVTEGYRILAATSGGFEASGTPVDLGIEFSLETETFNLMGYPFDFELPVEVALEPLADVLVEIMNDDGLRWNPDQEVNTLGNLIPGEGYIVTVSEDVTFSFNTGGWMVASHPGNRETPDYHEGIVRTGLPYTIMVSLDQELKDLSPETIEIYDGVSLVGKSPVSTNREKTLITAWQGNSEYDIPGFTTGNSIRVVLRDAEGKDIIVRTLWGDGIFGEFPYADIELVKDVPLPTEFVVEDAYPNPFNSTVNLRFGLPEMSRIIITVYDLLGRQVHEDRKQYEAGYHRYSFKADPQLVSGLYFIRISMGDNVKTQKVILLK